MLVFVVRVQGILDVTSEAHNRRARRSSSGKKPSTPSPTSQLQLPPTSLDLGAYPTPRSPRIAFLPDSRAFRNCKLTATPLQPPPPSLFDSPTTANMDQAKLARMQASVRIGELQPRSCFQALFVDLFLCHQFSDRLLTYW